MIKLKDVRQDLLALTNNEGVGLTSQRDAIHNAVIINAEGVGITSQRDAIHNGLSLALQPWAPISQRLRRNFQKLVNSSLRGGWR